MTQLCLVSRECSSPATEELSVRCVWCVCVGEESEVCEWECEECEVCVVSEECVMCGM